MHAATVGMPRPYSRHRKRAPSATRARIRSVDAVISARSKPAENFPSRPGDQQCVGAVGLGPIQRLVQLRQGRRRDGVGLAIVHRDHRHTVVEPVADRGTTRSGMGTTYLDHGGSRRSRHAAIPATSDASTRSSGSPHGEARRTEHRAHDAAPCARRRGLWMRESASSTPRASTVILIQARWCGPGCRSRTIRRSARTGRW